MSPEVPAALRYLRRMMDDPHARGVADAELLQRFVTHRDETAFELLLWRHAGMVLGVCRAVLRDHHLAEDAFQATFLALARKAASIGRRDVLAGWLYRVAHNAALKAQALRLRDPSRPLTVEPLAPPDCPDDDLAPLLHEELGRLPDKYRTPLVLCFLEGLSHADAARVLGWPKGTVAGRVARAREILRQRLTRRAVVPAALFATAAVAAPASAVPPALVSATARAAPAFASGGAAAAAVSAPVLRLTEGVLHAMFLSKLKSVALAVGLTSCLVLGGTFLGGGALAQKAGDGPPGAGPADRPPGAADDPKDTRALRARSVNNLKQIALAVHNYHDVYTKLPNNVVGADGKPLLSWRVLLLPYLDQQELYKQFKLDEPWDSEHNLKLLSKIPVVYRTGAEARDSTGTYYQGFADADAMFPPGRTLRFTDVVDGTSNTILVIEGGSTVPWTKPADLPYTSNKPLPKLGGAFPEGIRAALVDGAVITIKREFNEKAMRLAITRNDGQPQNTRDLLADEPPRPVRPPRRNDGPENLERAMREAELARHEAMAQAERAAAVAEQLRALADQAKKEAEALRAETFKARQEAEASRRQSVLMKQENDQLKATLRDVAAQLNKLVPPDKDDKKAGPDEVKALAAELQRLRDEVERLKKMIGK